MGKSSCREQLFIPISTTASQHSCHCGLTEANCYCCQEEVCTQRAAVCSSQPNVHCLLAKANHCHHEKSASRQQLFASGSPAVTVFPVTVLTVSAGHCCSAGGRRHAFICSSQHNFYFPPKRWPRIDWLPPRRVADVVMFSVSHLLLLSVSDSILLCVCVCVISGERLGQPAHSAAYT